MKRRANAPSQRDAVPDEVSQLKGRLKMKLIMTTMAAIVLTASAAQAQQQNICASWACNGCVYQNTQALGRAGDPRVLRLAREKQLRGGAP